MYNHTLNVNLDICLKICTNVIQKIPDIDEEGIAKSLLPYIQSLLEIYSRIYPTSNHLRH